MSKNVLQVPFIDVVAYDRYDNRIEFEVTEEELQRLQDKGQHGPHVERCDCSDDCPVWYAISQWHLSHIQKLLGRKGRPG